MNAGNGGHVGATDMKCVRSMHRVTDHSIIRKCKDLSANMGSDGSGRDSLSGHLGWTMLGGM